MDLNIYYFYSLHLVYLITLVLESQEILFSLNLEFLQKSVLTHRQGYLTLKKSAEVLLAYSLSTSTTQISLSFLHLHPFTLQLALMS